MPQIWFYTFLSLAVVSALSFVGALALTLGNDRLKKVLLYLVSFSAGALLGDVFLHLFPEMQKSGFGQREGFYILGGILIFFIFEKFIHWHHSHTEHEEEIHAVVYLAIAGDALHNFIDGLIIAGSFLVSPALGVATTLAVIFHEIPHELGNFAVLVHGGWTAKKALLYNFFSSFAAFLGGIVVLILSSGQSSQPTILLALGASNFIYVALSDLVPEIHKETDKEKSWFLLLSFFLGMVVMASLLFLEK
ncbi:MAG: ZIP family metal transporter [Candidatus Doudnabacteria bacterium]|jgi:zinc and cadmium transporter